MYIHLDNALRIGYASYAYNFALLSRLRNKKDEETLIKCLFVRDEISWSLTKKHIRPPYIVFDGHDTITTCHGGKEERHMFIIL